MKWRVGTCLLALALLSCAARQPGASRGDQSSLAMAVPADASMAILLPRPWAHAANFREAAARLGMGKQYGAAMLALRGVLGFDPTDPAEVRAHGFDDQAGLVLFLTGPAKGPVLAIAVTDAERAEQSLRRIFSDNQQRNPSEKVAFESIAAPSGDHVTVARRPSGTARAAFLAHGGFLYVHPAETGDPVPDLLRIAELRRDQGLERERRFEAVAGHLLPADALLYLAEAPAEQRWPAIARLAGGIGIAFDVRPDRIDLRFGGQRQAQPPAGDPRLPPAPRVDLAAGLPAEADFWMQVSCSPGLIWQTLVTDAGADGARIADGLRNIFGANADRELLASFTGNFAFGMYPSTVRLAGDAVPSSADGPSLVVVAELSEGH